MTESISSSMNQSETNTGEESLNANLSKQSPRGIDLSGIPHFTPTTQDRSTGCSQLEPPLCNEREPVYEYEFTIFVERSPLFVTLWDRDDLSACQRACACNISKEQITYSETGNGFFKVRDEDWCFRKEVYQRSWTHKQIEPQRRKSSPTTVDEILATL